jgi:hypothetical protein
VRDRLTYVRMKPSKRVTWGAYQYSRPGGLHPARGGKSRFSPFLRDDDSHPAGDDSPLQPKIVEGKPCFDDSFP